jgi:hypothetical protein
LQREVFLIDWEKVAEVARTRFLVGEVVAGGEERTRELREALEGLFREWESLPERRWDFFYWRTR